MKKFDNCPSFVIAMSKTWLLIALFIEYLLYNCRYQCHPSLKSRIESSAVTVNTCLVSIDFN